MIGCTTCTVLILYKTHLKYCYFYNLIQIIHSTQQSIAVLLSCNQRIYMQLYTEVHCVFFLIYCFFFFFTDVGAVLQAALCLHLHRPLADHMGLSLPRLCSALCCASYPFIVVFYLNRFCTLSHQILR